MNSLNDLKPKDVALAHDWVLGYRGGERVLDCFCEIFPQSPLYTLFYKAGASTNTIDNRKVISSFLNNIPGKEKHYRKLLPMLPTAIEQMKLDGTPRLLLSSSHCVVKGLKKSPDTVHISYVHSPMRYLYDQFDVYFGKEAPKYQQLGGRLFRKYLTNWDLSSNSNVDYMIANSKFVQERIKKYYGRDSEVIYPFVDLADFRPFQSQPTEKEDFYLMVTAFAPNKRVDLAIETFNELKKPLKIIGSGQQEAYLKSIAGPNVEFFGSLTREEVILKMRKARAFLFPGVDDFGITPLESLAAGTPVIAFAGGGVLETMTPETSVFFNRATVKSLKDAVAGFESKSYQTNALQDRAEDFSKETFKAKINSFIERCMDKGSTS